MALRVTPDFHLSLGPLQMAGYLVYHPKRTVTMFGKTFVHHDPLAGNQNPYVWNNPFLHTYCHITQMRPEVGQEILWVSGDKWPAFNRLYCDLMFTVGAKLFWPTRNHISPEDPIVDSPPAYDEHYRWAHQHTFRRRRRLTLKANDHSFQPQNTDGGLIDIVPAFLRSGLTLNQLRRGLSAGYGSKPLALGQEADFVASWLTEHAPVLLRGGDIARVR
jgi:hypothetical protein